MRTTSAEREVTEFLADACRRLPFDRAKLIRAEHLTAAHLRALTERRAVAIHVPGFCPPRLAARAARAIDAARAKRWRLGPDASDMSYALGVPLAVAERSRRALDSYFRRATARTRALRDLFAPHLSPADRLRLELDELWPTGAQLASIEGRKVSLGLVRAMGPDTLLEGIAARLGACHIDDDLAPGRPRVVSANIYLRVPRAGGELAIWNLAPTRANVDNPLYRMIAYAGFRPGMQDLIHGALGPAHHVVRPRAGDLILLDSARPHAVQGFSAGQRATIQCFVQDHGPAAPLLLHA